MGNSDGNKAGEWVKKMQEEMCLLWRCWWGQGAAVAAGAEPTGPRVVMWSLSQQFHLSQQKINRKYMKEARIVIKKHKIYLFVLLLSCSRGIEPLNSPRDISTTRAGNIRNDYTTSTDISKYLCFCIFLNISVLIFLTSPWKKNKQNHFVN